MAVDPAATRLFIPPELKRFKLDLFERIGARLGGVIRGDLGALNALPDEIVPIVGCTPDLKPIIAGWRARGRRWIYWDRGYARRVFATDLPTGENGGYYRWHVSGFQLAAIRDLPDDRWRALGIEARPWQRTGRHIVVAEPSVTYERFHGTAGWTARTIAALKHLTDRPIVVRDKEMQRRSAAQGGRKLREDIAGAHCLVTHGSNAAVEAVIMGCPVFVDRSSAAALVGRCDIGRIEEPIYPERQRWLNALAYSQFNEAELVDGTLWRLLA